ncbi:hypothetical protein [Kitasatospora sp. NPDC001175]|uniref:hypothetical protein n=1 Tax=Kitasatospora sp. NPDC001175 TaxID=3157103 RepID=UPI003CFE8ED3
MGNYTDYTATGMDEEDALFLAERDRVDTPPAPTDAPTPGFSRFLVEIDGSAEEYTERLRSLLGAALDRAVAAMDLDHLDDPDSLELDLTVRHVPEWFAALCTHSGTEQPAPDFTRAGAARFTAAGHGSGWRLSGWLERFDWDSTFRTWEWWDITRTDERTLSIWVNAHGEDFFACDDLRWAAYTSGAVKVTGPVLVDAAEWRAQRGRAGSGWPPAAAPGSLSAHGRIGEP